MSVEFPDGVIQAARDARRVAVISGAGISSESGIPTFRGAGGLWRNFRAEELATPGAFQRDPRLVWEWYDWRRGLRAAAEPNPAHRVVAEMEGYYPEFLLITQNVDGLHRRAGSTKLVEIHGNIFRARCTRTGRTFELSETPLPEIPPRSPFPEAQGALVRPDIVWFGENYDQEQLRRVQDFLSGSDLVFVIGTSGLVPIPVYLTEHAVRHGALALNINPEPSELDEVAAYTLRGRAGEILSALWAGVRKPDT